MSLEQLIQQLRNEPSPRAKNREETYSSICEMEDSGAFLVVEIHDDLVIVTEA